ncbi:MAG: NADH-quinone oxidoreductase subunit K [Bacteroidetes bacterium RIFCSPLOWO2_02_FULL_36_8]|nr:MAG: NADH-quinone oxidoreductase subunit K [Bacteroidetes bacterium RIFCSPLOWO2_02_FULL_36_8]OFY71169.1 MAG: NADH-quinone oxidoreductase subunit K [Bacteroidetes bacterium RIFCSPLOWO2_12_FULL_37_12]
MKELIPLQHFLYISIILFSLGVYAILTKRNTIVVLMGVELILNSANINLVAFSQYDPQLLQGQMLAIFVIVLAAAEAAVGLAIILNIYDKFRTVNLDELDTMKG